MIIHEKIWVIVNINYFFDNKAIDMGDINIPNFTVFNVWLVNKSIFKMTVSESRFNVDKLYKIRSSVKYTSASLPTTTFKELIRVSF